MLKEADLGRHLVTSPRKTSPYSCARVHSAQKSSPTQYSMPLHHGLDPVVHTFKKVSRAVAEGASEAVDTLLAISKERKEISQSYQQAKEEFKHETDFHKGDFSLDKVQASYHPKPQQLHKPDPQPRQPDPEESQHRLIPEDRDSQVSFACDGSPTTITTTMQPTHSTPAPSSSSQTPAVLLGGPPVPADSTPTNPTNPAHLHAHDALLGGPPVPPDTGICLASDGEPTPRTSTMTSQPTEASSMHNAAVTATSTPRAGPGPTHPVYGGEGPEGVVMEVALDVSAFTSGVDVAHDDSSRAAGGGRGHGAGMTHGQHSETSPDESNDVQAVTSQSQVPIQQSIADVTGAPLPAMNPGAASPDFGPVVDAVRPAMDQVMSKVMPTMSKVVHPVVEVVQRGILQRHSHDVHDDGGAGHHHDQQQREGGMVTYGQQQHHHMHEGGQARSRM